MSERVMVAIDHGPAGEVALAWANHRAQSAEFGVGVVTMRSTAAQSALITASHQIDLLVIGAAATSQRAGITNATLPLKIAGQTACTVIVVPVGWAPGDGPVVVGWHDDPTSESALDFAAKEASLLAVPLTIVHTYSATPAAPMNGEVPAVAADRLSAVDRRHLADSAARIQRTYPDLTVDVRMHAGSAAVALLRAAVGASLMVVGSRGRGAIAGFFLGSVSHDVILNLPAPVAVVARRTFGPVASGSAVLTSTP